MEVAAMAYYVGSSPRMRGALYLRFVSDVADGIIPAYAGSTCI